MASCVSCGHEYSVARKEIGYKPQHDAESLYGND